MRKAENLSEQIFQINDTASFQNIALKIFKIQSKQNLIYKKYLEALPINIEEIKSIEDIPFLPIEFFKSQKVVLDGLYPEIVFSSSGTTGMVPSQHFVSDLKIYEDSFVKGFQHFFGPIVDYCILALLPSYLEREGSSLIYMAEQLIQLSENKKSGFFLNNLNELVNIIHSTDLKNKKIILLGVTYALLELAENYKIKKPELIVMETGGMKGKRKEMVREELHHYLCDNLGVKQIYSEYGMTELLSQAYSFGHGIFRTPPWMKVLIRDINDPFSILADEQSGGINVIDLANLNSCSFVMTQDLGKKYKDDSFEILGRFDSSDVRGCNLLVQ